MRNNLYPTIKQLKEMGLTDYQISQLIENGNIKHGFFNYYNRRYSDYSMPNSIFFLDIKDTLYHSKGHGNLGVLGRSADSLLVNLKDIEALGLLLDQSVGQPFTMSSYRLTEDNASKIKYNFPQDIANAQYKNDIPSYELQGGNSGIPIPKTKYNSSGPFKIVMVSSDDIQTQKNIITFLYFVYKLGPYIQHDDVVRLEKLFEESKCNIETFSQNLPSQYKQIQMFRMPRMDSTFTDNLQKFRKIIDNVDFLTTKGTDKSKGQLMSDYLRRYNIKNGLTYSDYNIFACGDDYDADGPMIKQAFALGGYGCLNYNGVNFYSNAESLRYELSQEFNVETQLPIVSNGFYDFYTKAIDFLSLNRTWDLADTMRDVNNAEEQKVKNRFTKTNHYIEIEKEL